jgi:hypothetical protein
MTIHDPESRARQVIRALVSLGYNDPDSSGVAAYEVARFLAIKVEEVNAAVDILKEHRIVRVSRGQIRPWEA